MNKILSQALKKAVSEYSPQVNEVSKDKRPDLFSLNNETELFQNDKGIIIKIDRSKDSNLLFNLVLRTASDPSGLTRQRPKIDSRLRRRARPMKKALVMRCIDCQAGPGSACSA